MSDRITSDDREVTQKSRKSIPISSRRKRKITDVQTTFNVLYSRKSTKANTISATTLLSEEKTRFEELVKRLINFNRSLNKYQLLSIREIPTCSSHSAVELYKSNCDPQNSEDE